LVTDRHRVGNGHTERERERERERYLGEAGAAGVGSADSVRVLLMVLAESMVTLEAVGTEQRRTTVGRMTE